MNCIMSRCRSASVLSVVDPQADLRLSVAPPGGGQPMGPRPSMGVAAPRAMPPYKYATGVRNPTPQVVQPIALQQVGHADTSSQKRISHHGCFGSHALICIYFPSGSCCCCCWVLPCAPPPGSASGARPGTGASDRLHAGRSPPPGAEANAG